MKPKLMLTALLAVVLLVLGGVLFIHFTNDHKAVSYTHLTLPTKA